jgi:hypothetical protein
MANTDPSSTPPLPHPGLKFDQKVMAKAPGLLPMLYRAVELEAELAVSAGTIQQWLKAGLPYQRDGRGHLWIKGTELSDWITAQYKTRRDAKKKIPENETYCCVCRKVQPFHSAKVRAVHGHQVLLTGICSQCGSTVNKGARNNGQSE